MRKLLCALGIIIFTPNIHAQDKAKISATQIEFANNQQISLELSLNNINRLFVKEDKITSINAPYGFLISKNDPSGSAYLNILNRKKFTAFINTQQGQHLSVLIDPKLEPGQTIELIASDANIKAQVWEKQGSYQKLVIAVLKNVMTGKTPNGYGYQKFNQINKYQEYKFENKINLYPKEIYRGDKLSVLVYRAYNFNDKAVLLAPNDFYKPHVRAVAISEKYLLAKQNGSVFIVITNGENS